MRGDTIDNHSLRSVQFYDTLREGFGGKERLALKAQVGYEEIELKGNAAMKGTGVSYDSLIVAEGYGSRMESGQWKIVLGLVCQAGGE
jgi:hypothetical protein